MKNVSNPGPSAVNNHDLEFGEVHCNVLDVNRIGISDIRTSVSADHQEKRYSHIRALGIYRVETPIICVHWALVRTRLDHDRLETVFIDAPVHVLQCLAPFRCIDCADPDEPLWILL